MFVCVCVHACVCMPVCVDSLQMCIHRCNSFHVISMALAIVRLMLMVGSIISDSAV